MTLDAPALTSDHDEPTVLGIAEVAELSGLSQDTLRWYEREGLLPTVNRGSDRRRRYTERETSLVVTLARLRMTGMSTEEMRQFSSLVAEGAASHGRRLAILERHRDRILARRAELDVGLSALDAKADYYRLLIDEGLDCDRQPLTDDLVLLQRSTHP